jgi:translation elongation factor EF-Ts
MNPATLETLLITSTSLYTDATIKIGEKLSIRRFVLMNKTADNSLVNTFI